MNPLSRAMRLALLGVLALSFSAVRAASFYVIAHQDDWQLFMGEGAFYDASAGHQVVFVYLTAGDAGLKNGGPGKISYYRAREEAARASLRLATAQVGGTWPDDAWLTVSMNGKNVRRLTHRNTTSYFLRLPDGNGDGNGFLGTGNKSIEKLRLGTITSISAVDNSATYRSWAELVGTLRAIFNAHGGSQAGSWVNTHDPDRTLNENDHFDHTATAIAATEAAAPLGVNFAYWLDYVLRAYEPNLSPWDAKFKTGLMGAVGYVLDLNGYASTYDTAHLIFTDRSRMRIVWGPNR